VLTKGWEAEAEGGQGLHFKRASEVQRQNYRAAMAPCTAKTTKKAFGQLYESMHPFTTDSHEARSFTRPNTTIQACNTTQKRPLLKPTLSNAEGLH